MNYFKFIDIPEWETLKDQIINFRKEYSNSDALWWSHSDVEINKHLPDLTTTFKKIGLTLRQLIFFVNLNNDIEVDNPSNPKAVFIHTDREDDPNAKYDYNLPILTNFKTTNAINIPLLNCEGSTTIFYELLNDNPDVYYAVTDCGGHSIHDVREVCRFELSKPAVIRINVPHAVWNPNPGPRIVATIRFYESTDHLLE